MIAIVECNENHRYKGIVKQKLFFHATFIMSYGVFDVHTRMHKFHFSSDARERNGVVFRIINSGVYRRMDTTSQKNWKTEKRGLLSNVIIMRLMETLRASIKKKKIPANDTEGLFFYLPFSTACLATVHFVMNAVVLVRCGDERKSDRV